MKKIGRNDPCPCGSGKKYKHCCFAKDRQNASVARAGQADIGALLQQAMRLHERGMLEESASAYQQAITLSPTIAGAHYNLGNVKLALGKHHEAAASYRQALELQPDWIEACCNLASTLKDLGQADEAIALFRRALALRPDDVLVHFNLGNAYREQGKPGEAAACYRKVLSLESRNEDAHWNLGYVLAEQGRAREALASLRSALALKAQSDPSAVASHELFSSLLFANAFRTLIDPAEYLALARGWEQEMVPAEARSAARSVRLGNAPLDGRRLKVGYISGDFRQHAVSHFLERVLACHDRSRIEVFAYYTGDQADQVTARFQVLAEHWAHVAKIDAVALLERVRADGIDVLVDLSGHTARNRLDVIARRAAPVQAHYLGYFASTGLTEMDYWIGDDILTPPALDASMSERVWRLPRTWISYGGDAQAPQPGGSFAGDGTFRIGTFTKLDKVKESSLELWSRLLLALPDSHLLLKSPELAGARIRQGVLGYMTARGIAAERIELVSSQATPVWSDHMAYHDRLDVVLDPIGVVSGGTTTCDALWMGVPVVTLLGDRLGSRMTASLLHGLGRTEWIADSPDDYIARVVALARDPARRAALRSTLRAQMAASQLCDAAGLARQLEAAYIEMFERSDSVVREGRAATS